MKIKLIILFLGLSGLLPWVARGWEVHCDQFRYTLAPDSQFCVTIQIAGSGAPIAALGFDLAFPADLIEFQTARFTGTDLENWEFKNSALLNSGLVRIAGFTLSHPIAAPETGALVHLNFRAKSNGDDSGEIMLQHFTDDLATATTSPSRVEVQRPLWKISFSDSLFSYPPGEIFTLSLKLTGNGQKVAAFGADLQFPADLLAFEAVDFTGTLLENWMHRDARLLNPAVLRLAGFTIDHVISGETDRDWVKLTFRVRPAATGAGILTVLNLRDDWAAAVSDSACFQTQPHPAWEVPIRITSGDFLDSLTFGGHWQATPAFDRGIDRLTPPPGMSAYAYWQIAEMPFCLKKDIRNWIVPFENTHDWVLKLANFPDQPIRLDWNPALLPSSGSFTLESLDGEANLREVTTLTVSRNQELLLKYRRTPESVSWRLPLVLTGTAAAFPVAVGGERTAGPGFDPEFDQIAPPPGMELYACLVSEVFPYYFQTDVRNWAAPFETPLQWRLQVSNAHDENLVLTWDSRYLPVRGNFHLQGLTSPVNMRTTHSVSFTGDRTLTISYTPGSIQSPQTEIDQPVIPSRPFELQQNYPNPINPGTTLPFQLSERSWISLKIFNLMGAEIRTLIEAEQPAGRHQIIWNGTDNAGMPVPGGIYFYQLRTRDGCRSRKMILME